MAVEPASGDPPQRSNPVNRMRWATQRVSAPKGALKRLSILKRHNNRRSASGEKHKSNGGDSAGVGASLDGIEEADENAAVETSIGRRIFFNSPLPASARDSDGRPLQHFKRNKIRTAKYTPLSFVPKNLWFQFHSIANVYFLFIIILSGFSIFGVQNPGLAAVPLIFILLVTAIKDAIEDWRRTVLDNELNNAPIHRLVDWENVNVSEERISVWRRFKKANTKLVVATWRWWKTKKEKKAAKEKGKTFNEQPLDEDVDKDDRRISMFSAQFDAENDNNHDDVEMTPVPSPTPDHQRQRVVTSKEFDRGSEFIDDVAQIPIAGQTLQVPLDPVTGTSPVPKRFYGSIIDPTRVATDKARFKREFWKDVRVGDFVRLYNEEQIPADIIVLSTSDSDGACYIETKNLDGETNLKVRHALHAGRQIKRARDCERTDFVIESEPPHANLYAYSGVVRWQQKDAAQPHGPSAEMAESVGINNLLLRGCTLRNTDWVIGVVAFAGDETKIMLNSGITPSKRAQISKDLNWNVMYNFVVLFFMCLVAGVVEGTTWGRGDESLNFFEFGSIGGTAFLNGFITFWAAVILFQNLVPISLYISLEFVRTAQAYFIYSDTWMYYEPIDYPCTPKSWNISDDLGQIEYIFSDKTGTLTQNVMEFKKCTINSVPYGEAYTEALAGLQKRQGINVEEEGARARAQIAKDRIRMLADLRDIHKNPYLHDEDLTFVAPNFVADLKGGAGEAQQQANERFMLALALCHTVITERKPGDPPKLEFKAQSPDEAALVATAKDVGFTVLGNTNDGILLNVLGEEREYTTLNTLEFNSTRKRMSAIIRMPDGKIVLFCKGADSIIYSRLKKGEQPELRKNTAEHLEMFAREGLRTLCIAQRELSEEEYQKWNVDHDLAASAVQEREDKLEAVADRIERELTLLGGTAIEDRLQDGVPDSIALLAQAGIKLWVLTGDKVETAINIGFSCNLLDNDMDLIILKPEEDTIEAAEKELDKQLTAFGKTGSNEELAAARKNHEPPPPTHALVIDGDTLKLVLDDTIRQKFLLLCKECRSVLCCRVSPSQKAAVVRMVKTGLNVMTLSIGDGANDVAMIQEAHVGVGIAGEEGRQAVMSSDYAIGQFRFLTRLVLVHGRWSYRRLAETVANFFYKNIVWVFPLFWFQIWTNFDCSYVYDYTYILLFNLAFTSLPIIFMGILDQDVDDKVSLAVPQLYRRGIERKEWTPLKFWMYMLDGLYQSVIIFWFVYGIFAPASFNSESGRNLNDYKRIGVYIVNPAVFIVNFYILLNTYRWDWFMVLITTISILLIYFWTGVYTSFTAGYTFYGAAAQVYGALSFWAINFFIIIVALAPRFIIKAAQKMYFPRDVDIIREQIRQGKFDYLKDVDPLKVASGIHHKMVDSTTSSETSKSPKDSGKRKIATAVSEDQRPIYPPSVAQTTTTHNPHSHNGSDGTDYTGHRSSLDRAFPHVAASRHDIFVTPTSEVGNPLEPPRQSMDRPSPSFDRVRSSMDRTRSSFEASRDFTSAAYLARIEGSQCDKQQHPLSNEHRS